MQEVQVAKMLHEDLPSISVVIPTYNSEQTLAECLESIARQSYPREKIEIVIADGGSKDKTLEIAEKFEVDKILRNPLRTGEAGKAVGVEAAKNEIVAFIDSDNILPSSNWLKAMIKPFNDQDIAGAEPLYYTHRRGDPLITRYCALMGMNDVLCFVLGNYDRYNYVRERWTELKVNAVDRGHYLLVELDERNIPTMGANGFLVRAEALKSMDYKPYLFDIDMVYQLVKTGLNKYAKVKMGIVHLFADNVEAYVRKTCRRIRDYLHYEKLGARRYPWRHLNKLGILKFILYTLLIAPIVRVSLRGYRKLPDRAWLFHPLACWLTLLTYGIVWSAQSKTTYVSRNCNSGMRLEYKKRFSKSIQ